MRLRLSASSITARRYASNDPAISDL